MRQPTSITIGDVKVIWNGYAIEYKLPPGYGGQQMMEFIMLNEDTIRKFKSQCER